MSLETRKPSFSNKAEEINARLELEKKYGRAPVINRQPLKIPYRKP